MLKVTYFYYNLGSMQNVMTPMNGLTGVTFGYSTILTGNLASRCELQIALSDDFSSRFRHSIPGPSVFRNKKASSRG